MKYSAFILMCTLVFFTTCQKEIPEPVGDDLSLEKKGTAVDRADVLVFQPAGNYGTNNVLNPGDFFPPGPNSFASMKRGKDFLSFNIHTTGLAAGAYTVWWVIFNEPGNCTNPIPGTAECGGGPSDLFVPGTSVLWATGGVVQANGVGNFSDKLRVGETRSETILPMGGTSSPLTNPAGAEVHLAIKYHGPASSDRDELYEQTHTFQGLCGPDDQANSYDFTGAPAPFSPWQCFDPQIVIFTAD